LNEQEKLGSLRLYNYPSNLNDLKGVGEYEEYQAHHEKLTCMKLSENGIDILTGSKDGSLIFWKLMDTQDPE